MHINTNLLLADLIRPSCSYHHKTLVSHVWFVVGLGKTEGFYKKTITPPFQEQHLCCRVTHPEFPTAAALPETPSTHCSSLADEKKGKEINCIFIKIK